MTKALPKPSLVNSVRCGEPAAINEPTPPGKTGCVGSYDLMNDDCVLSIEELRQFPGCEQYTDEQAQEIVTSLMQLAEILYFLAIPKETNKVVCLPDETAGTDNSLIAVA